MSHTPALGNIMGHESLDLNNFISDPLEVTKIKSPSHLNNRTEQSDHAGPLYGNSLALCVGEEEVSLSIDTKQLQSPEADKRPQSLYDLGDFSFQEKE